MSRSSMVCSTNSVCLSMSLSLPCRVLHARYIRTSNIEQRRVVAAHAAAQGVVPGRTPGTTLAVRRDGAAAHSESCGGPGILEKGDREGAPMSQPGWYPDPGGAPGQFRYWDGTTWSPIVCWPGD
ncbi:DUF2510 domain-containing protein [Propionicicella superfundia]|uniref:DUF2510 domain-containing protein n=1 Tax=Propionicicella superfundia TaxID=348582 RepID=UPI000A0273A3